MEFHPISSLPITAISSSLLMILLMYSMICFINGVLGPSLLLLSPIVFHNVFRSFILKHTSLLTFLIQGISSVFLQHHVSKVSIHFLSALSIVHVFALYKTLFLVLRLTVFAVNKLFYLLKTFFRLCYSAIYVNLIFSIICYVRIQCPNVAY